MPHVGCTTFSIKISNMAAVLRTPCAVHVTPVDLRRLKSMSPPGGCDSAGVPGHSVWSYGQWGVKVTAERRRRRGTEMRGRPWPAPVTPVLRMGVMNVDKIVRG